MPKVHQLQNVIAHEGSILSMSVGQRTSRIFSTGGEDKCISIWSVGNNNPQDTFGPFPSPITASSFSQNEDLIAFGNQGGTVSLYELNSSQAVNIWPAHRSAVHSVAFHPTDDRLLLTCGYDGKVHVLCTQQKRQFQTYDAHKGPANCVAISCDGRYAASGGDDHSIKIFDLVSMKICGKFNVHTDSVLSLAFHPYEPLLVSVGADRSTHFFDLERFRELQTSFPLDSSPISKVRFSPTANCVVTASPDYLRVIGWAPPASYDNLPLGFRNVHDISFLESAVTIAASSGDKALIYRVNLSSSKPFANSACGDVTANFAQQKCSVPKPNRPTTPRMLDIAAMKRIPSSRSSSADQPNLQPLSNDKKRREGLLKSNLEKVVEKNSAREKISQRSKVIKAPPSKGKQQIRLSPDADDDESDDDIQIEFHAEKGAKNSKVSSSPTNLENENLIYNQFREKRASFMSLLNERYSKITRFGDMLDANGLTKALENVAESGDLGPEVLSIVRMNPDAIKLEHTSSIMRIASILMDKEPELAVNTVEETMQAFGKLVHATLLQKSANTNDLANRKELCQSFVESFKEMQPKLRAISLAKKEYSQSASEILNEWRVFLR